MQLDTVEPHMCRVIAVESTDMLTQKERVVLLIGEKKTPIGETTHEDEY